MKSNEFVVILLFAFVETSSQCIEEANAQQPLKCYQGEQDLNIDGFIGILEEPLGMIQVRKCFPFKNIRQHNFIPLSFKIQIILKVFCIPESIKNHNF